MKVTKVFNNNVVLAVPDPPATAADEVVLMGRGLGFGVRPGQTVEMAKVERTFHPGAGQPAERIVAFLAEIPAEHLAVTDLIVAEARVTLGDHVGRHVVIPLADHLSFAVRRAVEGVTIHYPLRTEVQLLYPREVAFGGRAIALVREHLGVELPAVEAVPLALHFVNAQFAQADMGLVVELTEAFAAVVAAVGDAYGLSLDEDSLDVARFVTHLRYFAARQARGDHRPDELDVLHEAYSASNPRELACARTVAELLRSSHGWRISRDEELFLALHIGRLTTAAARR